MKGRAWTLLLLACALGCDTRPHATASAAASNAVQETDRLASELLTQINDRRAQGQRCGTSILLPSRTTSIDRRLSSAARGHATDLIARNAFSHQDAEGRSPHERASLHGFMGEYEGEAIARGPRTAAEAANALFASERHCRLLMSSVATHSGAAVAREPNNPHAIWVVEMGRPEGKKQ